jgi:type II restriction enzyme
MAVNRDKQRLWDADTAASVNQFNTWFVQYAPDAFRRTRANTVTDVEDTLTVTNNLTAISADVLKRKPEILPTLRMCCCPPLAVDRLIGLADCNTNLVKQCLERKKLPATMKAATLDENLQKIVQTISGLLDQGILPWLASKTAPTEVQRRTASVIIADRLCTSVANPIIRNAQEKRQLDLMEAYLANKGYTKFTPTPGATLKAMAPGTFSFRTTLVVGTRQTP